MNSKPSLCAGCSAGCSIWIDENQGRIWRIRPRENQEVNRWWICDAGRHGFGYIHSPHRFSTPLRRTDRGLTSTDWSTILPEIKTRFQASNHPAALLSPMMTLEEAELAARWIRSLDPTAPLALGPVPTEGDDQTFPGGFTIRAEKCPNRRGVERILKKWTGRVVPFEDFLDQLPSSEIDALWIAAGYPHTWLSPDDVPRLKAPLIKTLVVQDLFPTALSDRADFILPSTAWPERSGTFINASNLEQTYTTSIRPPTGLLPDGAVFWRLLGNAGLYRSTEV